jgi:hypothetical protein
MKEERWVGGREGGCDSVMKRRRIAFPFLGRGREDGGRQDQFGNQFLRWELSAVSMVQRQ